MQDKLMNKGVYNNQEPPNTLQLKSNNRKNFMFITVVIFLLVLFIIIFPDSQFISLFLLFSLPVIVIYLLSRYTYNKVYVYKKMPRSALYSFLFIFNIITYLIVLFFFLKPKDGPAFLYYSILIIFSEIVFDVLAIVIYEIIRKIKNKNTNRDISK